MSLRSLCLTGLMSKRRLGRIRQGGQGSAAAEPNNAANRAVVHESLFAEPQHPFSGDVRGAAADLYPETCGECMVYPGTAA